VLEQVRGLRVDLERVLPIEQVQVEPVVGHHPECITTKYGASSAC
jgi:hypothetical protein